jgi:DNA topoisomerase-1
MKLIIVESPTKARTLTKFLKGKYAVEATMGHIRDLPKAELGVDVEAQFAPRYVIPRDKAKRVSELKSIAAKADEIILATDPDREGEAIAWHIAQIINKETTFKRIVFHEITEKAIKDALEHAREVDIRLVDAQQARRILDRLVGYKLSPLLWKKLSKRWLSAGRVQSVAVRLIVEREREVERFAKKEYWTIDATFQAKTESIVAKLTKKMNVAYETTEVFELFDGKYTTKLSTIHTSDAANAIIADFASPYTVTAVDKRNKKKPSGSIHNKYAPARWDANFSSRRPCNWHKNSTKKATYLPSY